MKDRVSLLRNIAMMSIASYAELAFGLVMGVVIARSLGSAEFGHYAFAVWVCGTLITLSNNALTMSSIKFIAEVGGAGQPDVAQALGAQLRRWQGISSAIVLTIFLVAALTQPPQEWRESLLLMIPLLMVGAWARSGYMMMAAIGKGNEHFEVESAALLLSAAVNLVLVLLLAGYGGSIVGFFAIYAVCGLVQNLTARIVTRRLRIRSNNQLLQPPLAKRLRRHLLQSGALVVVGLLGDRTIEVLLLKTFSTSDAVGFFAIAGALTKGATYLLAGALSSVLLPTMSRAFGQGGSSSVVLMLRESIRFYWFLGLAIAGLGASVAPGAVRLLYGAQYEAAIPAVVVNLMVSGFVLVSAAFNAFQTSSDRQGDRIKVAAFTLGVNIIAGLALVPRFGLNGALGSLAITKVASIWFSWRFASQVEGVTMPFGPMIRLLNAAVAATLLAAGFESVMSGRYAFLLAGFTFIAAYAAASVLLGAWTKSDFSLIADVFRNIGNRGRSVALAIEAIGDRIESRPPARSRIELLCNVSGSLGLTGGMGALRSAMVRDLRVLAYHRVLPKLDESTFAFDTELISARQEEFDWQMAYVARHFEPVSCRQVADAINFRVNLPKRAVMVTFDDGFQDNYDVAFPVLRKHGLKALFFLSTGYIGTRELFWFDWLVHILIRAPKQTIRLDAMNITIQLGETLASRRAQAKSLLNSLKRTSESHRVIALQQLKHSAGFDISDSDHDQSLPLTWKQVRIMSEAGMEFGSHTVSHPILSTVTDPARLRFELEESKSSIERVTGQPAIALAYPVGKRDASNSQVVAATALAGYQFAFTYQPGINKLKLSDRFLMKRLAVERYTTRHMFSAALELPELFAK